MELSSIEINQRADLEPVQQIARKLGLEDEDVDYMGKHVGKVRLEVLDKHSARPDGKLILVTAMTPTRFGEGKTLTSISLGQALHKLGKSSTITLREPSMGPVFGVKGGGTGGGYAQVAPMEKINLHFTGDIHAIGAAHNLLAGLMDNHLFRGNKKNIDVRSVLWPRTIDVNERALRDIVVGLGGTTNGVPRESGFVMTSASEVMAVLSLATSRADLKQRLGRIVVALDKDGEMVTAADLDAHKSMAVVLNEAIQPNIAQTLEHSPTFVHGGPFANIAHGTSSVVSMRIALKLCDYVVNECGFGADLGAEKFFNLVTRSSGLWPSAAVIVCTCRAVKFHGGVPLDKLQEEDMAAFEKGLRNLEVHVRNVRGFGVPVVVAINRFPFDTANEVEAVKSLCSSLGVECAPHDGFGKGGEGAIELAEKAVALADSGLVTPPQRTYELEDSVEEKVRKLATGIYGADDVYFEAAAVKKIRTFADKGFGQLPVCIAKTQSSLSDNPKAPGVPKGWTLRVTDVRLSAGAGFLVIICGNMMLLPGLPTVPAAMRMDVDENGRITGLS